MLRLFLKGITFSFGLIMPFILVAGIVYATNYINNNENSRSYAYEKTDLGYQYTWQDNNPTCQDLTNLFGIEIVKIQNGGVLKGYDAKGIPIYTNGQIITFKYEPSTTIIDKLDYDLSTKGLIRTGGKTIVDAVQKIQQVTGIK